MRTTKKVIEDSGVDSKDIKGMGISGQMHGLVMLDENGSVLRRSIIWCDQRTPGNVRKSQNGLEPSG